MLNSTPTSQTHSLDLADQRRIRSTTVLCVRRNDSVVMAADGQVTLGGTVLKGSAKKIRRMYSSPASKANSSNTPETSAAPPSNSPRSGAPTRCSATSKPSSSLPT